VLLLIAVGFALDFAGLIYQRHTAPYAEQTRYNTFKGSQSYQDGVAIDLDDLCRQWRTATDQQTKDGLADTIRLRSAHYSGDLPARVQECINEIG
jgi:hypothetical protein